MPCNTKAGTQQVDERHPEKPLHAISEVSEKTGVNSVTLRAWQRRYGLLNPTRTEKGHRLYSESDIERIQLILSWLDKGVSIGKVKPLLEHSPANMVSAEALDITSEVIESIDAFSKESLEKTVQQLLKEYPLSVLEKQFFLPIQQHLDGLDTPLSDAQRAFWLSLCRKCLISTEAQIKSTGKQLIVVMSFDNEGSYKLPLELLRAKQQGRRTFMLENYHGKLFGLDRMIAQVNACSVVIVGEKALQNKVLNDLLTWVTKSAIPIKITGTIKQIHPDLARLSSDDSLLERQDTEVKA
ncbi:MerR family transcriptional regulator [Photobacterium sanguinicancri]|uniref:Helix-turn-helix-type transcriptional regulator n=1 Tax=Photobacterium sanguinicancri TaxID=875932 RepID=A0ABX4FZS0_9GAMM|nr:MerR family transcriptional regulator [Photobacterium sanguinicancri]OZS44236.1 helix-turn-helix-type transcriptional regulator [Photobacterium sanguinicancri]